MKECLLCSAPLKLIKFKCAEGHVCKTCYEKASMNFSQTIKRKTKAELLEIMKAPLEENKEEDQSINFLR
jgi:recombinational DNA repair protein (RecF pathway)